MSPVDAAGTEITKSGYRVLAAGEEMGINKFLNILRDSEGPVFQNVVGF